MTFVLQKCRSESFVSQASAWTQDPGEARQFDTVIQALEFATARCLRDIQLVPRINGRTANLSIAFSSQAVFG
jgi:hypothetical protein